MSADTRKFIAIEGTIGVGKTTLARRLAETLGYGLVLEQPEANPFLERFYENQAQHALATQLFFLFQRSQQLQALTTPGAGGQQGDLFHYGHIADYLLEKDRIFASINLSSDELDLYHKVYKSLTIDVPPPDLVIYLQAPAEVLQKRIARRGHSFEQRIPARYLEALNAAYASFFHDYQQSPLLIVNAAEINLATSEQDYQGLLDRIAECTSGRNYFNPLPAAETPLT